MKKVGFIIGIFCTFFCITGLTHKNVHFDNLIDSKTQTKSDKFVIAYSSDRDKNPDIYYSNLTGEKMKCMTNHPLRDGYPCCSPDGEKIVFYAYADEGKTWSIFVMNRDGSGRKRLTHKKYVFDTSPRWSEDGKKITFDRSSSDWKTNKILIMNSDGSDKKEIPNINGLTPSFTSEGNIIYYTNWDDSGEICIADKNGNILKKLTDNNTLDSKPDISPDGSKIVFASDRDGNREIYVMNIDGSNPINLSNHSGNDGGPRWSPDGSKIIFISKRDGNYQVYVMNADGSDVRNVSKSKYNDIQATWLY